MIPKGWPIRAALFFEFPCHQNRDISLDLVLCLHEYLWRKRLILLDLQYNLTSFGITLGEYEMINLHFDIRDLFRVIRLGWSGKKIWTGLCGLFAAYILYTTFVTIGYAVSGMSVGEVWSVYGLFPGAAPAKVGGFAALLHALAMILAAAVFFLATSMMCKITYQQLRGDDFFTSGEALEFVKKHWGGVIFGPVACLALLVGFVVSGMIIGWLAGLIPVVGEFAFSIGFIPIFFLAMVAVFMVFAIIIAFVMSPAIVGTVGEDALEVVIQAFSLCWSQPWRIALYLTWTVISVWIGTILLSGIMTLAFGLMNWSVGMYIGDKLPGMLSVAQGYLPPVDFTFPFQNVYPEMRTVWSDLQTTFAGGSVLWAGRILALMLICLTGVLIAYTQAAFASGTCLIYVIMRNRKDGENMLEWEDLDFENLNYNAASGDTVTERSDTPSETEGGIDSSGNRSDSDKC